MIGLRLRFPFPGGNGPKGEVDPGQGLPPPPDNAVITMDGDPVTDDASNQWVTDED